MRRAHDLAALPLTSKRWQTLKAHFGNAGHDGDEVPAVPKLLRRWVRTVGTYEEEYAHDPLRESYLHQGTILDVAYAVVPHLVLQLERLDDDRCSEVLDDLELVEAIRRTPRRRVEAMVKRLSTMSGELRDLFMQSTRDRHPELPEDLAEAYLPAIAHAKQLAGKAWGQRRSEPMGPHRWRRHVRFLRAQGLTDEDITFGVRVLTREDAEGFAPVNLGGDAGLPALRTAAAARAGFQRRARLGTKPGHLVAKALHALAWIEQHAPVGKMLASPRR